MRERIYETAVLTILLSLTVAFVSFLVDADLAGVTLLFFGFLWAMRAWLDWLVRQR